MVSLLGVAALRLLVIGVLGVIVAVAIAIFPDDGGCFRE